MESFNFLNSDHDIYNEEFLLLNPRLVDFEEERHDNWSSVPSFSDFNNGFTIVKWNILIIMHNNNIQYILAAE